jgi:hypothetical protein
VRSAVKLIGPPIAKALTALAKVAEASPIVTIAPYRAQSPSVRPFREEVQSPPPRPRTGKLISRAGMVTGDYDFVFEWARRPTPSELEQLLGAIDEALRPLTCLYTIDTK